MGICILGQGDCETKTETRTNVFNEALNETITETFAKQVQSHRNQTSNLNKIMLEAGGDITIEDVNQEIYSDISLTSWQKMQNSEDVKNMLSAAVDNAVEKNIKAEKSFGSGAMTTTDITNIKNTTKNILHSKIGVEQVNECINSAFNQNVIEAKAGGSITVRAINQKVTSKAAANCMTETINKTLRESTALQNAINDLNVRIDAKSKGIFGPLEDLFGSLGGMIGMVIAVIILIAVLGGLGYLAYTMMKSDSGSSSGYSSYDTGSYGAGYGQYGQGMAGIGEFSDGSSAGDYSLMSNIANYLAGLGQGKMNGWF